MSQQLPFEWAGRPPRGTRAAARPKRVQKVRPAMNEKEWAKWVGQQAIDWGWLRYHTHRSDFSPAGYPDETLVRPPRLVIAELKSDTGVVSPKQQEWLLALGECPGVEVYLWRPRDQDEVIRTLAPAGWKIH